MTKFCSFLIFCVTGTSVIAFPPPTSESEQNELTEKEGREAEGKLLSRTRKLTFAGKRSGEGYFSTDGKKLIYQSERLAANPFYQIYLLSIYLIIYVYLYFVVNIHP